jgi:methyltransferase
VNSIKPSNFTNYGCSAPGHELKSFLAGRIARAAAVFCVDEIIVYNDGQSHNSNGSSYRRSSADSYSGEYTAETDPDGFLAFILSYLECPPHLRKPLFPFSRNLRGVGALPSLDLPHHAKPGEWCQYREGVTVGPVKGSKASIAQTPRKKQKSDSSRSGSKEDETPMTLVDVGFPIAVPEEIPPNTRVTIKFAETNPPTGFPFSDGTIEIERTSEPVLIGEAEAPSLPREEAGYYWGYTVRQASSLGAVFTECPFDDGYDVSFGTSERGQSIFDVISLSNGTPLPSAASHALIVFGGLGGLEVAVAADSDLRDRGINRSSVADLFDYYVDICPGQGSRTIRTEEAVMIALAQLRSWTATSLQ